MTTPRAFSDYIVYVDESGDHGMDTMDPSYPIFVLAFCVFRKDEYATKVVPAVQKLKFKYFGHDLIILHEHEIRKQSGPFKILRDRVLREAFIHDVTSIMDELPFTVLAAGVYKIALKNKYTTPGNPYDLAVEFLLERLRFFLRVRVADRRSGRPTHWSPSAESRPGKQGLHDHRTQTSPQSGWRCEGMGVEMFPLKNKRPRENPKPVADRERPVRCYLMWSFVSSSSRLCRQVSMGISYFSSIQYHSEREALFMRGYANNRPGYAKASFSCLELHGFYEGFRTQSVRISGIHP
jgi:hypothetical protein